MNPCIYCGQPADSAEHWIPRSFGAFKGVDQLKDRLCDECNKALGKELDQEVSNTGLTGYKRFELEIQGRHKNPPTNPFLYRVLAKESATTMTMACPYGDYKILAQTYKTDKGDTHAIALRQLVFKMGDDIRVCVPFPPAYDAERLKALFKERGVEGATLESVYLDRDEELENNMDVRRVLTDALGQFSAIAYGGIGDGAVKPVEMAAGISKAYIRAVAKIAFHYYLAMSTEHSGHEFLFQPIRRFIRYGEGDYPSFVSLTSPQFIEQLANGKCPVSMGHFFGVKHVSEHLVAVVQLFVGPNHVPPPSRVLLGLTKKEVAQHLHHISYYDEKDKEGYVGEIETLVG